MPVIYLVRHGQASWGKRDYDALSDTGMAQARHLGAVLGARIGQPDLMICGNMKRHRQTAEQLVAGMGIAANWQTNPGWNEYDHQELIEKQNPRYRSRTYMMLDLARTMKPRQTFQQFFEQALARWTSGQYDTEYRENWPQFRQRVDAALDSIAASGAGTTLVFTSGGAISACVKRLWQVPDSEWPALNRVIANASLTKIVSGKTGLHLVTFNDHSHFAGEHQTLLSYR